MTTVTLATVESRPLRFIVREPVGLVSTWGAPTTAGDRFTVEATERANAALVLARLGVITLLSAGAVVAGALVGRL